jgi:CRP/FNR family cyclic AMP-dependent transcriptional regulator
MATMQLLTRQSGGQLAGWALVDELSRILRFPNEPRVAALERERTRALIGPFTLFVTVTYIVTLRLSVQVFPAGITSSAITVPIIILWSGALYGLIKRSQLPFECFGLTLQNWHPALREALHWSAITCAAATLFKLGLIWFTASFADQPLFNFSGNFNPGTSWRDLQLALALALVYAAATPLQEFVRAWLQTSLERCLVGPSVIVRSIVISNALFAAAHLHLSMSFAIFVFFPGLLWGALFSRQRNIVGVSASHILCGCFVFLILGFEPWY